jgi:hypothetical protein
LAWNKASPYQESQRRFVERVHARTEAVKAGKGIGGDRDAGFGKNITQPSKGHHEHREIPDVRQRWSAVIKEDEGLGGIHFACRA